MKVGNVKVFFRYEKTTVQDNTTGRTLEVKLPNGKIEAIAVNTDNGEEIARREVKLRHGDKPSKELGRKYAFKKLMDHAMNNNILPKSQVGELWVQFGANCKQPSNKLAY